MGCARGQQGCLRRDQPPLLLAECPLPPCPAMRPAVTPPTGSWHSQPVTCTRLGLPDRKNKPLLFNVYIRCLFYSSFHNPFLFSLCRELIYGAADPICLPCPGHGLGEKPARGLSSSFLLFCLQLPVPMS